MDSANVISAAAPDTEAVGSAHQVLNNAPAHQVLNEDRKSSSSEDEGGQSAMHTDYNAR